MRNFTNPFNTIRNPPGSKRKKAVGAFLLALVIIGVLALFIQGFDIIFIILLAIVVVILVCIGQQNELIGAAVFSFLMIQLGPETAKLLNIWFDSAKINQTIQFFVKLGYLKSILVSFFILSTIEILTSSMKLFQINNSNEINNKEGGM